MIKLKNTNAYKSFRKLGQSLRKNVKRYFFKRKLNKATPVFVYQMGKVASSSIFDSLTKQYPGTTGHAHHIGPDNWHSEELYNWAKEGNQLKIISPIREPIGRNISAFFQSLDDYTGIRFKKSNLEIDQLIDIFLNEYKHDRPLTWFDDNIKKHFGIDVYASDPPGNGIATYTSGNISLLILRVTLDDAIKEKAIRAFLSFPSFTLNNRNIGTDKEYKKVYKEFVNSIRLPDSYLLKMKESKYFSHFYTDNEMDEITSKFRNK